MDLEVVNFPEDNMVGLVMPRPPSISGRPRSYFRSFGANWGRPAGYPVYMYILEANFIREPVLLTSRSPPVGPK